MYFPKPAINENDLAIIERGDTAEHSISAGQYVSWKGKLGKANAAILQGATLDDSLFDYDDDGSLNGMADKFKIHIETKNWSGSCNSKDSVYFGISFAVPANYRVVGCNCSRPNFPSTQINARIADASAFDFSTSARNIAVDVVVTNMYSSSLSYSGTATIIAVPY